MDNIDVYIKTLADWLNRAVELVKTAWAQPHAPEMLGVAALAFALLLAVRKIKKLRKPIKRSEERRVGKEC